MADALSERYVELERAIAATSRIRARAIGLQTRFTTRFEWSYVAFFRVLHLRQTSAAVLALLRAGMHGAICDRLLCEWQEHGAGHPKRISVEFENGRPCVFILVKRT